MRVREAKEDDLREILRLGREFHERAGMSRIAEFDDRSFLRSITNMMAMDEAVVAVVGDKELKGMACVVSAKHWFNDRHRICQELFWYALPGAGLALLKYIEDWSKEWGNASLSMVAHETLRPEAVGALYQRRGYTLLEKVYTRAF